MSSILNDLSHISSLRAAGYTTIISLSAGQAQCSMSRLPGFGSSYQPEMVCFGAGNHVRTTVFPSWRAIYGVSGGGTRKERERWSWPPLYVS
jgi:hypothetical protein